MDIPEFDGIRSHFTASENLRRIQVGDKFHEAEFGILIQNLLAEDVQSHKQYARKVREQKNQGLPIEIPTPANLWRTLNIWNTIFQNTELSQDEDINIRAKKGNSTYSANEMSEGEKVTRM